MVEDDPEQDVSGGLEPNVIPLLNATETDVTKLKEEFTYISDSIFPDNTPICDVILKQPDKTPLSAVDSDEDDSDDIEDWTCDCQAIPGACSVDQGYKCDCVGSFGNFYTTSHPQTLNLDALPKSLPLVECSIKCPCHPGCVNRLTQLGVRAPICIQSTPTGLGAFYSPSSSQNLPRGSFISLYAGEYLTTEQARQRWKQGYKDNYTLSLKISQQVIHIDPRYKGNMGRFLNHSCDPNCVIQIVHWGGGPVYPRAAIFTKRVVQPGEELTFDYGDASGGGMEGLQGLEAAPRVATDRTKCFCGAGNCRGFMPYDETL